MLRERLRSAAESGGFFHFMMRLRVLAATPAKTVRRPWQAARYVAGGDELTNFTYELANLDQLAGLLADALGTPRATVDSYLSELEADAELELELADRLRSRPDRPDHPRLGVRRLHYCMVRAERPRLVVEAGVADGLGTAVLLRALQRNAVEGDPGELLSFDIDPGSGWLLGDSPGAGFDFVIGDTAETLDATLQGRHVDLFLQDSVKTFEHETMEFEAVLRHASPRVLLVGADVSSTGALRTVCADAGARYYGLTEQPLDHFWGNEFGFGILQTAQPASSA